MTNIPETKKRFFDFLIRSMSYYYLVPLSVKIIMLITLCIMTIKPGSHRLSSDSWELHGFIILFIELSES